MKSLLSFAAAQLFAAQTLAFAQVPPEFRQALETADAAWNRRDLKTAMQFYAPEATLSIGAMHFKGIRDIQTYMQSTLDSLPRNITRRTVIRRIEKVGSLVLVDTGIMIERVGADGKAEVLREFFGVNVIRQEAGSIKLLAVRLVPINKE